MAHDLGDRAPADDPITATLPITAPWYEIEITDPTALDKKGWAYIVRSGVLTSMVATDYVDFDVKAHRVNGQSYTLGFGTDHPGFEYMALYGSGVDILDRTKIRMYGFFGPPWTEKNLPTLSDDLIKDGPVRVIVRGGKGLAYSSMVSWSIYVPNLPPRHRRAVRFSTDFSPVVSGSLHYNGAITQGLSVDGITDTVPSTPLSHWWQLSTEYGTVVQVGDSGSIGGRQTNYYRDNAEPDEDDTGDGQSFGDVGVYVENSNHSFTYRFGLYFLPGAQPNLGSSYEAYFSQPLSARASLQGLPMKIYLPGITSGWAHQD